MDFERALCEVGDFLDRRGAPWAVIGGLGLAALDIRLLMGLPGVDLDEVRATFARHGMAGRFDELRLR